MCVEQAYYVYYESLATLWYSLYTNVNVLYSATDHGLVGTLVAAGQTTSQGAIPEKSAFIDMNLGFLVDYVYVANLYFLLSVACLTLSSFLRGITIDPLLNLSTKDFSYLILSLNTSTIWLLLGFSFVTFLFSAIMTRGGVTLLAKNH